MPLLQLSPVQPSMFLTSLSQVNDKIGQRVVKKNLELQNQKPMYSRSGKDCKKVLKTFQRRATCETFQKFCDWSIEKPKEVKKKVSFSSSVKTWDGLRTSEGDFDELLFCFLVKGQSIGDGDILQWTKSDCVRIYNLCCLLGDLIARLRQADPETKGSIQVPCLPHGGGHTIKVERSYEPYLLSLLSVMSTALRICISSSSSSNSNGKKSLMKWSTEQKNLVLSILQKNNPSDSFVRILNRA